MALFEEVVASFWDTAITAGVQPPLTPGTVDRAERELGVKLPEDLLHVLRIQNGGAVADGWSVCPSESNFYAEDHVPFDTVLGLAAPGGIGAPLTMLDTPYLVQEWDLPSSVVLLDGEGHYWVALDYRACGPLGEPVVAWIDNEMSHELQLAPSFRDFVEMLGPATHLP